MRVTVVIVFLMALLGCQSTASTQRTLAPIMKQLLAPKSQEIEAHSLSNYVNRASELASKKGYEYFALVSKLNSQRQPSIWVYLYSNDEELQSLYEKIRKNNKMSLIDVFITEESKGRRYMRTESVPGVA
ncbi:MULTISPECIES: hypothetical protein [Vibrio]|uniref:hypothetical protein n=1 Tax=Vibrio TaxID=662 RepID=UPI00177BCE8D|nr:MULTISPECIES: hypothetical protein [Vibrio]MBD1567504.1 hypothetical protein [Vibrio sp. S12_S33]MDE1251214.1 hypothetical protein [Vibrio aestuarianus]